MERKALPEVGEKAWCVSKHGIGMQTEYVSFRRPEVTAIRMTKGPWYIKDFAGSWRFQQEGNSGTKVTFTYSIKFRGMLEYLIKPFSYLLMKNIEQRLKDLKYSLVG
jgi:ribosome-associated toxin RatA of RatAB toxin-antitoxin module